MSNHCDGWHEMPHDTTAELISITTPMMNNYNVCSFCYEDYVAWLNREMKAAETSGYPMFCLQAALRLIEGATVTVPEARHD